MVSEEKSTSLLVLRGFDRGETADAGELEAYGAAAICTAASSRLDGPSSEAVRG